ncbi:hypothetical protein [Sphingomonas sp. LM7]|uniref:hypothetical protein n=1 Tax=Sphingomonas sp. LM7 TaxID=1938607 RepID=UPI0009839254|nr:hypothetical protein [Sphingomonas sp. LM7]AQR75250.1 hypothetical protein BXU08_17680 [Sphingomonas sp. LM7]
MADFAELAKGLLSLEINTIEKNGMSGQKMPSAPHALIEVAQGYWDFLCRKSFDFGQTGRPLPGWANKISKDFDWGREPFPQPAGAPDRPIADTKREPRPAGHDGEFLKDSPDEVSVLIFDHLREIATWMAEMQLRVDSLADAQSERYSSLRAELTPDELYDARQARKRFRVEDRSIFHRIRRNSDQFKEIVRDSKQETIHRGCTESIFSPDALVAIRKGWDIGTEIILMQTVIQIDGDVVNRFQIGVDGPDKATLHGMHGGAVELSFKYWSWMIDAMGKLAGKASGALLGR